MYLLLKRNTFLGSQMVVTYLSEESDRANVLARLGVSYGIGMVVGPSLGGYVTSNFGEQASSLLAAGGSILSIILVLIFVPSIPKQNKTKTVIDHSNATNKMVNESKTGLIKNAKEILKLFLIPGVGFLLVLKMICGIPIGVLQSMFSSKLHISYRRFAISKSYYNIFFSFIKSDCH